MTEVPRLDAAALRQALDPTPREWELKEGFRAAAVLIPILARGEHDHLVFTLRPATMRHHPGQVSFPGGRRDGTESPVQCALRETTEEIGVPPEAIDVLGSLPSRMSIAGFWVNVLVGRVQDEFALTPEPGEVERILEIPLATVTKEENWHMRPIPGARTPAQSPAQSPAGSETTVRQTPHLDWHGDTVWGLTGRLTLDLVARIP